MRPAYIDGNAIGRLGDHAHVVSDQHNSGAVIPRQVLQQRDDLCLDRNVQRGRRFVRDDQNRIGAQRQGDHYPLALAARELVRVGVDALDRCRDANSVEPADCLPPGLGIGKARVSLHRLGQLTADRVKRIERGQRVLEDGANATAADFPQGFRRQGVDALVRPA